MRRSASGRNRITRFPRPGRAAVALPRRLYRSGPIRYRVPRRIARGCTVINSSSIPILRGSRAAVWPGGFARLGLPAAVRTPDVLEHGLLPRIGLLLTLIHTLGLVSAVHAVARVQTPQGAIAWALMVVTCSEEDCDATVE